LALYKNIEQSENSSHEVLAPESCCLIAQYLYPKPSTSRELLSDCSIFVYKTKQQLSGGAWLCIQILSNQTTALRRYLALYKNIEQSDNISQEVHGFV
jgi:hypothetical protein